MKRFIKKKKRDGSGQKLNRGKNGPAKQVPLLQGEGKTRGKSRKKTQKLGYRGTETGTKGIVVSGETQTNSREQDAKGTPKSFNQKKDRAKPDLRMQHCTGNVHEKRRKRQETDKAAYGREKES